MPNHRTVELIMRGRAAMRCDAMRSSTYKVQKRGVLLPNSVSDAPGGISEDAVEEAGWCLHLGKKGFWNQDARATLGLNKRARGWLLLVFVKRFASESDQAAGSGLCQPARVALLALDDKTRSPWSSSRTRQGARLHS